MAEYIFKEAERSSYLTVDTNEIITTLEKKERIVRCRDCKSFAEDEQALLDFGITHRSRLYLCRSEDPDGFCAWGELDGKHKR